MRVLFRFILVILLAMQPLQSYSIINIDTTDKNNGFQHLSAELCGSKYSLAVSHSQKISNLLDKINIAVLSDISVECICCQALDSTSIELDNLPVKSISVIYEDTILQVNYLSSKFNQLIPYSLQVRAPPSL